MLAGLDQVVIPYEATDFPSGSKLNRTGSITVPWDDVLWAAVTVGKAQRDLLRHGRYSYAELFHRVACISAYFDRDGDERLVLSGAFKQLDPSEKGVVSFYSGMTFAKLYADEVLSIPWLMHISRYSSAWSVGYGSNPKRPDLFGCNAAGEWAVAEAKGRVRVTTKLVTKMKEQKSAVASIHGVPPTYRFGSATRFERNQLSLRVVDPLAGRRAQDVPLDPAAWLVDYYRPIVELLEDLDARQAGGDLVAMLPGTDVEIGADQGLVSAVQECIQLVFKRPPPRSADQVRIEETPQREGRLRLSEQPSEPESRAVVERIVASASNAEKDRGRRGDGLYVRARRG